MARLLSAFAGAFNRSAAIYPLQGHGAHRENQGTCRQIVEIMRRLQPQTRWKAVRLSLSSLFCINRRSPLRRTMGSCLNAGKIIGAPWLRDMRERLTVPVRPHAKAACLLAVMLPITQASAADPGAPGVPDMSHTDVINRIVGCFSAGEEAVLLREGVECTAYGDGVKHLLKKSPEMPFKVDPKKLCPESNEDVRDWRHLPGNGIKRIVKSVPASANPRGIRIIGAVFCDTLDLSGLDLSYSLVIDKSLFLNGFEARNFHTRGDLSFEKSLALDTVMIARSRIEGTVFGSDGFIQELRVLDSKVEGSLLFRRSTIPGPAIFDTVAVSGELSVRDTLLSYLRVQFSTVGGVFDLTGSQARCAYLIMKSQIGDLVAVGTGFGTSTKAEAADQRATPRYLFDWRPQSGTAFSPAGVNSSAPWYKGEENRDCKYWSIAFPTTFRVSDTHVRSSLCLRSFHWLLPQKVGRTESTESKEEQPGNVAARVWRFLQSMLSPFQSMFSRGDGPLQDTSNKERPESILTFNDVDVGATSFVDLAPAEIAYTRGAAAPDEPRHKFEAIGLKTHSFIFNFDAGAPVRGMSVGGLAFEQAYSAHPKAAAEYCAYDPDYYKPPLGDARSRGVNVSDMRLPQVSEIMSWLENNCLQTTQPLSAFIDLAKKTGDGTAATALQIQRENEELRLQARRTFGLRFFSIQKSSTCPDVPWANAEERTSKAFFWTVLDFVRDVVAVLFGGILWLLADHGYHPQKVGWFVLGVLVVALAYFWLWVRVVGFRPAKKSLISPISWAFLFDRLLPAYRIREDHYDVAAYYKWTFGKDADPNTIRYMTYLGYRIPLVKADEADKRRVEARLENLKWGGIVLSIFLVAAINALFKG
jgi:hypothetical protein